MTNAYRSLFLCFYSQFVSFYCGHSWLPQNDIQNMVSYIGVSSYLYIYIYIYIYMYIYSSFIDIKNILHIRHLLYSMCDVYLADVFDMEYQ